MFCVLPAIPILPANQNAVHAILRRFHAGLVNLPTACQRLLMPQALDIPWIDIRNAYLQGVPLRELALEYGVKYNTIAQRAHREQWPSQRQSAQQIMSDRVQKHSFDVMTNRAEQFVARMADDVETRLAKAMKFQTKNIDQLVAYENAMERLNKRARLTFGLTDSHGGNTLVNVQVLADIKEQPKPIDVPSETQHVEPEK